jgi:hypothetical protein
MVMENIAGTELERAVDSLTALGAHLDALHGRSHRFSQTSATQARDASKRFANKSATTDDHRVLIYSIPIHVRKFQTSVFVTSIVIRRLIDSIMDAHKRNDLTTLLGQLRSLIERIAHLHYLTQAVAKTLEETEGNEDRHAFLLSSHKIERDVSKALYGTAVNWESIADKDLARIDLKQEVGKGAKERLGPLFATQILDKIDSLNKRCVGTRATYEILCEFLHPNIGDLLASATDYLSSTDRFKVQHMVMEIDMDKKPFGLELLSKVYEHIVQLTQTCSDDFSTCANMDKALVASLTAFTREVIKKNRRAFRKGDVCPCSSGKQLFRCCGRGIVVG